MQVSSDHCARVGVLASLGENLKRCRVCCNAPKHFLITKHYIRLQKTNGYVRKMKSEDLLPSDVFDVEKAHADAIKNKIESGSDVCVR